MKYSSLSLVMALLPMTVSAAGFSDVPTSSPAYDAINYVQSEGIVSGYPDGTYKPNATVNRAELTKIIVESLFDENDIESCDTEQIQFSDINDDAWYVPYLCVAVEDGIISGYEDGTFHGERTVNLAEASKIITKGIFEDIDPPADWEEWYTPYVQVLAEEGALPTTLTTIDAGLSRGDLAQIIFRLDAEIDMLPSLDASDLDIVSFGEDDEDTAEDFAMSASDCFPDETYDAREQMCYIEIECDTEAECKAKMDAIDAEADSVDEVGNDYQELNIDSDVTKAVYTVSGDTITPEGTISKTDDAKYREVWNRFTTLFPETARKDVVRFEISSDGKEGSLAATYALEENPMQWALVVDDVDAFADNGTMNTQDLTYSLIHEMGHLLTLNAREVPPSPAIDDFAAARNACLPQFFTGEGCSNKTSIINLFFQSFWKDIYATYADAFDSEDEENIPDLYSENPNNFVSDYAASNPVEDIAESFTEFVLNDRNKKAVTIADKKQDFFYNHSSLVTLRSIIRQRLTLSQ